MPNNSRDTQRPSANAAVVSRLVMVETRKIRPYHRNPRKNDTTVQKLVELIPKTGFNVPLVLDRQNVIVKGHTRWKAAIRLGMREIPCVYSEADEETIRLDRLADNRVQEFSRWDKEALGRELGALDLEALGGIGAALDFSVLVPELRLPGMAAAETAPDVSRETSAADTDSSAGDPWPLAGDPGDGDAQVDAAPSPEPEGAPPPKLDDYAEAMCPNCGHIQFVLRR